MKKIFGVSFLGAVMTTQAAAIDYKCTANNGQYSILSVGTELWEIKTFDQNNRQLSGVWGLWFGEKEQQTTGTERTSLFKSGDGSLMAVLTEDLRSGKITLSYTSEMSCVRQQGG